MKRSRLTQAGTHTHRDIHADEYSDFSRRLAFLATLDHSGEKQCPSSCSCYAQRIKYTTCLRVLSTVFTETIPLQNDTKVIIYLL